MYGATVKQILELEKAGCEIVRVACLDIDDAKAIKEIKWLLRRARVYLNPIYSEIGLNIPSSPR